MSYDYDVLVIGSGFGGSVSALRLTEKGYKVGVLEAGRRFDAASYPKTSWDVRRFLWAPRLGCYGIQRIHLLKDVVILAAAGVGGGSLVYANTLYEPPAPFYDDPQWARITDWKSELAPCYDQAKRMLGVTANPELTAADKVMKEVAEDMGVGETFRSTPVGVFFGGPGTPPGTEVDDPFFGGQWVAKKIDGIAGGTIGEIADIPMTAHFIGGCAIGDSPETGVIDPYHRLYGHPGLHVVDGSTISANLGVNPSLTITAQAERAMALWPNKGQTDPRPTVGSAYRRLRPVAPQRPAVPEHAPAVLRLPIVGVGHGGQRAPGSTANPGQGIRQLLLPARCPVRAAQPPPSTHLAEPPMSARGVPAPGFRRRPLAGGT